MPTRIEWTDEVWNPVTGCTKISAGCKNCYASRIASGRLKNHPRYKGLTNNGSWTGEVRLHPEMLIDPFSWRKPRMCFVCSMSDLFHDDVPMQFQASVVATISKNPKHTFQVLTKRPENMKRFFERWQFLLDYPPPPNAWFGVTVENQYNIWRISPLMDVAATVQFVSCEPLLGPVILPVRWLNYKGSRQWVIVGAETGQKSRPMDLEWARDIRDQCQVAGVPFFMKSLKIGHSISTNPNEWPEDLRVREFPE